MSSKTKWSYCVGATGRDMAYALVSMYLLLYVQYTMNLTTAQFAVISFCVVLCLIWDAVNDLIMGIIIENAHLKWGKFKPWIAIGCLTNAIVIVCLFTIRPTGWAFVAFYSIGYLLWGMTFTMNDIAYWGMLPSLSSDSKTRNTLVTLMSVFCCVGQFTVAGVVPMVIAGNAVNAYRTVALVVALLFVAFQALTVFGTTESERVDSKEKISLKGMYEIFRRNDQLVHAGAACLLFNVGQGLLIIFGVNFFYVEFGYSDSGTLVFVFTVMYGLGQLLSQALYAGLTTKLKRMEIQKISIICLFVGYALLMAFGYILPKNVILLDLIGFIIFFFQGLSNLSIVVMLNNTIEYDEYRFAERHDSVISAVRSFSVKLSSGINQGLSTLVLIISGVYAMSQNISELEMQVNDALISSDEARIIADEYIAGVAKYQSVVLRLGMVVIPLLTIYASYVILKKKYIITEEKYDELVSSIANRKMKA